MFTNQTYTRVYAELSTYRMLAVTKATLAIKTNDHSQYLAAEELYEQMNGIITRNFGELDSLMRKALPKTTEDGDFPEWSPYHQRNVFSDAELEAMPVLFSDGSTVIEECDVPF